MDGHTHAEWFDSDGNYHAVLDGHAVTITGDAITGDDDADADGGTHMDANSHAPKLYPNAYLYSDHDGNIYIFYVDADGNPRNVHLDGYPRPDAIAADRGAAHQRAADKRADGRAGTGRQQPEHPLGR